MKEIATCEVCSSPDLTMVLNLGPQPMCDDLVAFGDTRVCREYPIEIVFCEKCRTAHQRFQIPKDLLFPRSYHYRSRFTADVLDNMSQLADACTERFGDLAGRTVLDVGCNDGSLLDCFRLRKAKTVGIEPTDACVEAARKGHITFNSFLDKDTASEVLERCGVPTLITFTNVFAHIENLGDVLASLKMLISQDTSIVIENHYLGSVLDRNQFDTFYHEHPRTYSYTSFTHIARALGLHILDVEFPSRYGGNIRVYLGRAELMRRKPAYDPDRLNNHEQTFLHSLVELQGKVEAWRDVTGQLLKERVAAQGPFKAKAFPGRAAILVKLLALDIGTVSAVYEKPGSLKIGCYVPGTRIPIRSDKDLMPLGQEPGPLLNLAWHIRKEIEGYLRAMGYRGEIIDILRSELFAAQEAHAG